MLTATQYFDRTNFRPRSDAWSSYASFIERFGSFMVRSGKNRTRETCPISPLSRQSNVAFFIQSDSNAIRAVVIPKSFSVMAAFPSQTVGIVPPSMTNSAP